jgi:hypothetical protein
MKFIVKWNIPKGSVVDAEQRFLKTSGGPPAIGLRFQIFQSKRLKGHCRADEAMKKLGPKLLTF